MSLDRLEELFHAACDLPAAERSTFLDRALGEADDDLALRAKLDDMLRLVDAGEDTLPRPEWMESAALDTSGEGGTEPGNASDAGLEVGAGHGRYRLLERIGEGGFGVVYRAEQLEPVRREVAVKVLRSGMDRREVVARFEAERQALALMDHPSIARVFDGGVFDGGVFDGGALDVGVLAGLGDTEAGRPFVVMELVRGEPITRHCEAEALDVDDRLPLFVEVCDAVQHAHQKGVVHRDLKPSNVLVSRQDGRALPKVIDFGIAKALHERLTDRTLHSAAFRMLGTPAYMSPEQAAGGVDVDTRSDVYSLGVLLYELLTGATPFDATASAELGLAEVERRIREDVPSRPSQRVDEDCASVTGGGSDLSALRRRLRGDLDWIVLRALEKDRERRYATASELAEDVRRHLRDEPVSAGPPSAAYRLRKFVRRHRTQALLGALLLLTLLGGGLGTIAGLLEASRQRDAARVEAQRARVATDFLVETLALADPEVALVPDLSVRQLLDRAAERTGRTLGAQPEAEARVRATLGRAYESLDEHALAEVQLRRAVELSDRSGGLAPRELYDTLWTLTHVLYRLELPDAQELAQRARRQSHDLIRAEHPNLAAVLDALIAQVRSGVHHLDADPPEKARALLVEALALAEAELAADDPLWTLVADGCMDAGFSHWYTPHEAKSDVYFRCAVDIRRRVLPPSHPDIGEAVGMLAGILSRSGRADEAEDLLRTTLDDLLRVFEADDFQVAFTAAMLGENLVAQGRFAEAEPLLLRSHEVLVHVTEDPATFFPIDSYRRVIQLYDGWGRRAQADPYRRELAEIGTVAKWPIPWPLIHSILGPEHAAIQPLLEKLDQRTGGVVYGTRAGDLRALDLAPILDELEPALAGLPDGDPRTVVFGRLLLAWSNGAHPDDPIRARMARMALDCFADDRQHVELDLAEAWVWRANDPALGAEERSRMVARALGYVDRVGGTADSWFTANAKARIARGLLRLETMALEPIVDVRTPATELVDGALETLRVQLGTENRDYVAALEMAAAYGVEIGAPGAQSS